MLIASTSLQEGQRLVDAQLAGPGHEGADVLGQAAAAEAEPGVQEAAADPGVVGQRLGKHASRRRPVASQTSAIALMKEILVARKALAATLTSSAVAKSVTTIGHAGVQQRLVDLAQDGSRRGPPGWCR